MKKKLSALILLLVLQILLAVGLWYHRFDTDQQRSADSSGLLIKLRIEALNRIEIKDRDQNTLVMSLQDQRWVLTSKSDIPADPEKIRAFTDKLPLIQRGWPAGRTLAAAKAFKVAVEDFERQVTLETAAGEKVVFYVGTAPSFRKLHVRLDPEETTYVIEGGLFEFSASTQAWWDPHLTRVDEKQVHTVITPRFTLIRAGEKFILDGVVEDPDMNLDWTKLDSLMQKLLGMPYLDILSGSHDEGLKSVYTYAVSLEPTAQFTILGPLPNEDYLLKTSQSEFLFRIKKDIVEGITKLTREELIVSSEQ